MVYISRHELQLVLRFLSYLFDWGQEPKTWYHIESDLPYLLPANQRPAEESKAMTYLYEHLDHGCLFFETVTVGIYCSTDTMDETRPYKRWTVMYDSSVVLLKLEKHFLETQEFNS